MIGGKDQDNIRYRFEHRILRDLYFNDPNRFVLKFLNQHSALYGMLDNMYRQRGLRNPYRQEQFSVSIVRNQDGVCALKIQLPPPPASPLCHRIYAFFDDGLNGKGYFCVESTEGIARENKYLCRWLENGSHIGYEWKDQRQGREFSECVKHLCSIEEKELEALMEKIQKEN